MIVDMLARKLSEMETDELEEILRSFKKEDNDSYEKLVEVVEDAF
jgi:hypothetical protein